MRLKSVGATCLGILFAAGTGWILLADVHSLADVTVDHVLSLGTLLGTIAAGHYFVPAVRNRQPLAALGLALAFMAGTFICVAGSAGRGGEAIQQRQAEAVKLNDERKRLEADLVEARDDLRRQKDSQARECASGDGQKCKGRTKLATMAASHVMLLEDRLAKLQPEQVANVKLKKAAEVLALVVRQPQRSVEAALELLWPFAQALIWELLTITFLSLGLGHRPHEAARSQGVAQGSDRASDGDVGVRPAAARYARWKARQLAEMASAGVTGVSPAAWHRRKRGKQAAVKLRVVNG